MREVGPFIYGLVDPLDPGHVRYVGMACRPERPFIHSRWAHWARTRPSHFVHWIRKLHAEGREYVVLVLRELHPTLTRQQVGGAERLIIRALRGHGHQLTNVSPGGEGGRVGGITPESRARISAALARRTVSAETRARIGAASARRVKTPEWRAKISATLKGRKLTTEELAQRLGNQRALGAVHSETSKERQRAAMTGRKVSPETRARMCTAQRAAWAKRKGSVSVR